MKDLYICFRRRIIISMVVAFVCLFLISTTTFGKCNLSKEENNHPVEELVNCLQVEEKSVEKHFSTQRQVVFELHGLGKEAIPSLINNISNSKKVSAFLGNPLSSYGSGTTSPAGVISAYIVELILGRERLKSNKKDYLFYMLLGGFSENYVYWDGIILNEKKERIKAENLPVIQKIYQEWWEKNKNESICALRESWKKGVRVLDGREYKWR